MSGQLEGKVAIVTGGAKGLGAAVVRLFVAEGAKVVISDVDVENGERLAAEIGPAAAFERHDVASEQDWERVVAATLQRFGGFHVLVNNAGIALVGTIETQTAEQWRRVNAVIADGAFFGCQQAVRTMKTRGGGTIVNVCSVASLQGEPYVAAYCAAKGAVEALTRSVAVHCAQGGIPIRCNSLHPGPVASQFGQSGSRLFQLGVKLARPLLLSTEEGARTSVYLASSPEVEGVSGSYFVKCKAAAPSRRARDDESAAKLWELSERLCGVRWS